MDSIIKTYIKPQRSEWGAIMKRATIAGEDLSGIVSGILDEVKSKGDEALRGYAKKFDGVTLTDLRVSAEEFAEAEGKVDVELKNALEKAAQNIRLFHESQRMKPITVEVMKGVVCTQKQKPIAKVGLYIPGGNSPLFSTVLMLSVPAKIAGCKRIVLCTPPDKQGKVHPAILLAAKIAGVDEIYKVGGAQAVAAMAYGTESIPQVSKIFGPGNRFVMEAKQQVCAKAGVAIDMPAGPSEVMVLADDEANLDFISTDFLSQSEHGPDSQSILVTTSEKVAAVFPTVIEKHLDTLPRREMMCRSLSHSSVVVLDSQEEMMEFANEYAPEHLIINTVNADELAEAVENAGSVFIGPYSPESAGDYASGTNHTLPTSGYAKSYSGVNLDSFMKKITYQHLSREGLSALGATIEIMAQEENLMAHRLAVSVRLK